ncbi:MAG: lipopolysaccharide heptosyltransferase II [Verrucomicrobiota bacterium]
MKILILKPSSMGDVVQALPVLRLIKSHLPRSEVYWWLASGLLPLLEGDPHVTGIFAFERDRWKSPRNWNEVLRSIQEIRSYHFDWVIDLQGLARSGLFAWLANGQFTIGVNDPREGAAGFYDVFVPRPSFHTHAVDWYLQLLPVLGVPVHWNFTWLRPRPEVVAAIQQKWKPDGARWIVLNPGARWSNKRWPVQYYAELLDCLAIAAPDLRFAILGSDEDALLGEAVAQVHPRRCLNLAGQTSIPEMIEWIRLCDLMVTNDTGPMHVAAALRKPVVSMFGPTEPRRTGPYFQTDRTIQTALPCVPCLNHTCHYEKPFECLRAIRPQVVYQEIQRRLSERSQT